jgi:hypothetical protein
MFESDTAAGLGITGAKRTSWEHHSPRDLLIRLAREYPKADDRKLAMHLRDCVLGEDQDYLLPIFMRAYATATAFHQQRS